MKKNILFLLLFCSSLVIGQNKIDTTITITGIPANGLLLKQGWKFHPGDNKTWANPAFNDSSWTDIDPSQLMHYLPQVRQAQICWFRISLNISPILRRKAFALLIKQYGAAEVYLNGVLIRTYGKVSASYTDEETFSATSQPLTMQFGGQAKQVIAVRYSFNKKNPVIGYGNTVMSISIMTPNDAWESFSSRSNYYSTRSFVAGCFIILFVLHLFIFLIYSNRKSLYLSLYAFLQACTLINGLIGPMFHSMTWDFIHHSLFSVSAPLCFVFFVLMVYELFGHKRKWLFQIVAWLSIPVIAIQFVADNAHNEIVLAIYAIAIYLEVTRLAIIAYRNNKPGAQLFLWGELCSLFFFLCFNFVDRIFPQPYLLQCLEVSLAFLIPAILVSILLAREFAENKMALEQKLREVETLSRKNLEQEIEKQYLLENQNQKLEQQVTERTKELNTSIENLKATQTQLIQSEKMASLGELTAGIAHEIQNPLNFVNNFSEVNKELLTELKQELAAKNYEEAGAIADDVIGNEEKINHHGKRADFIVKGMLEHSRTNTGEKQLTNLNVLADEFLNLSYHGLRAKNKSFNAEMVTNFDPNLPKVNISQQDIGRVLLNLFNNAFYAVNQKQKTAASDYKPEVTVTTSSENGQVVIKVKDNGNGIPESIIDKILQPFFTTKPTGEGTGLGLSLSYDIVVKGHGGSIDVDTKEGEFTSFIVKLPLKDV